MQGTTSDAGGGTRFATLRSLRLGQMRNFVIAELKGVLKDLQLKTSGLKGDLQHRIEVRALRTAAGQTASFTAVCLSCPTRAIYRRRILTTRTLRRAWPSSGATATASDARRPSARCVLTAADTASRLAPPSPSLLARSLASCRPCSPRSPSLRTKRVRPRAGRRRRRPRARFTARRWAWRPARRASPPRSAACRCRSTWAPGARTASPPRRRPRRCRCRRSRSTATSSSRSSRPSRRRHGCGGASRRRAACACVCRAHRAPSCLTFIRLRASPRARSHPHGGAVLTTAVLQFTVAREFQARVQDAARQHHAAATTAAASA